MNIKEYQLQHLDSGKIITVQAFLPDNATPQRVWESDQSVLAEAARKGCVLLHERIFRVPVACDN